MEDLKRASMQLSLPSFQKTSVVEVKYYCPICLVSEMHKILSEVLANRPSSVIEKVKSKHQNAFIKGRKILYFVLIANK